MPIRMEDDPQQPRNNNNNNPRNPGGGGGNGLLRLLPFLLLIFRKNPKMLLLIAIIGGAYWYFSNGFQMPAQDNNNSQYNFGADLKEEEYDKALVFAALSDNNKNKLPEKISLKQYAPQRLNQGRQGSCVGWSSAYAARTILHSRATGANPDQVAFSPSYLYNKISLANCQGAYINEAMDVMKQTGGLLMSDFPYDPRSCGNVPARSELTEGAQFRTKGYNRLSRGGSNYKTDLLAVKQHLAAGAPVVIGMMVGGTFMRGMEGKEMWTPSRSDYMQSGFSGHAMCVIGYDDYKAGGSFEIMNSWGKNWGQDGIAWVRYQDFDEFVREAYGLFPMGKAQQQNINKLAVKFGLVDNRTGNNIAFKTVGNRVFRTVRPLTSEDRFKVEVTNSIECYTYIFGEETDGSSYVLFPYSSKHSPYCGITGTRLFPRDQSMSPDELGNRDRIAVLISKQPLDYEAVNTLINRNSGLTFASKVGSVIAPEEIANVKFEDGQTIDFEAELNGKNIVGVILEIDKR
ncbi:MAG: C1 family peptidase [Bacteroidota bacterium]